MSYETVSSIVNRISDTEKLYLSRLLYNEGYSPSIYCSEGMCAFPEHTTSKCSGDKCSCGCHLE